MGVDVINKPGTISTEFSDGMCEKCGSHVSAENLYVDLYQHQFTLVCPQCFYKRNQDNDKHYFVRVKEVVPDIPTYKEFGKIFNDPIAIGNTYPYLKTEGTFMTVYEKTMITDDILKHFFGLTKIKNKFHVLKAESKCSEQIIDGAVIFLVAITAKVKYKTYLEYMESKMFNKFRVDCPVIMR